jgi:hypothetical protein
MHETRNNLGEFRLQRRVASSVHGGAERGRAEQRVSSEAVGVEPGTLLRDRTCRRPKCRANQSLEAGSSALTAPTRSAYFLSLDACRRRRIVAILAPVG